MFKQNKSKQKSADATYNLSAKKDMTYNKQLDSGSCRRIILSQVGFSCIARADDLKIVSVQYDRFTLLELIG